MGGDSLKKLGRFFFKLAEKVDFCKGTFRAQTGTIVHSRNFLVLFRPYWGGLGGWGGWGGLGSWGG